MIYIIRYPRKSDDTNGIKNATRTIPLSGEISTEYPTTTEKKKLKTEIGGKIRVVIPKNVPRIKAELEDIPFCF